MFDPTIAAYVFTLLSGVGVVFQLALALGAPWGEMAMGGRFPGRFPQKMRIGALVQMLLLIFIVLVVLTRAGLIFSEYYEFSQSAVWFVVALCMVSAILNTITPSKKERMMWSPVTIVLLICGFIVARS